MALVPLPRPADAESGQAEREPGTADERIEQIEIQLGHLCNNRCVFCSSGFITSMGLVGQESSERSLGALEQARAAGARKVTFLGGEPTLQRDFPLLLRRARELGYEEIVVFTNGVRSHQRGFLESLLEGGPLTFRISIQGGNEEAHDAVTGRRGAFQRIVNSLELLNELGQKIQCNACLNVKSYRSVGGYPELVRRFGISEVHLDQINPLEIGNRPPGYIDTILARYSEQAPHLASMLAEIERTEGPGYAISLGNIPYCVMPQWAHRIRHAGQKTPVLSSNLGGPAPEVHDKYARKTEHTQKPASCARCVFDPVCMGVYDEYVAKFGASELVPVSAAALREAPSASELFTLVEWEALARLRDATPPSGCVATSVDLVPREPEARFHFQVDSVPVSLVVRHPALGGAAVALSERLALHVESERLDGPVAQLVGWAFDQLRQPDDPVRLEPAAGELARRVRWGSRCRGELRLLVEALTRSPGLGRFRHVGTQLADHGESATLLLADGAERLSMKLVTQPPFLEPRVRALFPRDAALAAELRAAVARRLREAVPARAR